MDTPPSMSMLQTIEDVSAVEKIDDYHYRDSFNASNNISEKIVQLSVSNNWGLKEITLERQSLDNIFAQLSGKIKTLKEFLLYENHHKNHEERALHLVLLSNRMACFNHFCISSRHGI